MCILRYILSCSGKSVCSVVCVFICLSSLISKIAQEIELKFIVQRNSGVDLSVTEISEKKAAKCLAPVRMSLGLESPLLGIHPRSIENERDCCFY